MFCAYVATFCDYMSDEFGWCGHCFPTEWAPDYSRDQVCFVENRSDVCLLRVSINVFQLSHVRYIEGFSVMAFIVYYS